MIRKEFTKQALNTYQLPKSNQDKSVLVRPRQPQHSAGYTESNSDWCSWRQTLPRLWQTFLYKDDPQTGDAGSAEFFHLWGWAAWSHLHSPPCAWNCLRQWPRGGQSRVDVNPPVWFMGNGKAARWNAGHGDPGWCSRNRAVDKQQCWWDDRFK